MTFAGELRALSFCSIQPGVGQFAGNSKLAPGLLCTRGLGFGCGDGRSWSEERGVGAGAGRVRRRAWRWDDEEIVADAQATFAEGVTLFNAGEYYECHDVLEGLWNNAAEPQRSILHGILQCAVGLYHLLNQVLGFLCSNSSHGKQLRSFDFCLLSPPVRSVFESTCVRCRIVRTVVLKRLDLNSNWTCSVVCVGMRRRFP